MSDIKWTLEGLAIGPKGQQMDVQVGFASDPTAENIAQAKVNMVKAIWASFPTIFYADPMLVEAHVNGGGDGTLVLREPPEADE